MPGAAECVGCGYGWFLLAGVVLVAVKVFMNRPAAPAPAGFSPFRRAACLGHPAPRRAGTQASPEPARLPQR